jgi:glycosyltransferase involved in cell wall biosynthesis
MNVLMISGDPRVLEEGTDAHARLLLQKSAVERLDVAVWPLPHSFHDIRRMLEDIRYDVITSQDPFWRGLIAALLAKRAGIRLNVQLHADLDAQPLPRRLMARWVLRRADSVRVVSTTLAEQVRRISPNVRVRILPVFVDLAPFRSIVRNPESPKMILWIGRFEKEKDPEMAIALLRGVRKAGTDATLVMLGAGKRETRLRAMAVSLPVSFPGWQDPKPYLARAAVVLSTSPAESWGASIVEALAAGVPVVSLDVGVAKEAGAVVVSSDDMAKTVVRVLQSGEEGMLKLDLSAREEWARQWRESLE